MKYQLIIAAAAVLSVAAGCSRSAKSQSIIDDLDAFQVNQVIREITVKSGDGDIDDVNSYFRASFDHHGRIKSIQYLLKDLTPYRLDEYIYNRKKSDRVSEIRIHDDNGYQSSFIQYEYDLDDNLTRCSVYGMNSDEIRRWENRYEDGHIVHTDFYSEGELMIVTETEWGEGIKTERVCHLLDSSVVATHYSYHSKNRLSNVLSDDINICIEYDVNGLPSSAIGVQISPKSDLYWDRTISESIPHYYEYEFDRKGNWIIRRDMTAEKDTLSVVVREIRY